MCSASRDLAVLDFQPNGDEHGSIAVLPFALHDAHEAGLLLLHIRHVDREARRSGRRVRP